MLVLKKALISELPLILDMQQAFYTIEQYPFDAGLHNQNLDYFISNPHLGSLWIIMIDDLVGGYCCFTHVFSFEFGGLTAFIDELFLLPEFRGKGWGSQIIEQLIQEAKLQGIKMLHLESERHNESAINLYSKSGFRISHRYLMHKNIH